MYRRLSRATRATIEHWHKQPLAAFTLLMLVVTAIGGPGVCLLDCWLHDLRAAQLDPQGLHQHHAAFGGAQAEDTASTRHEQHRDGDGTTPGALTIAVVLMLGLLPMLSWARLRTQRTALHASSLAIPPPQRPPRDTVSLAFIAA